MGTWVVRFVEKRDRDDWRGLRRLLSYDPDQIQMLHVTPHRWTPFLRLAQPRKVVQIDRSKWDYKTQVLATRHMSPWRVLVWFKFTEVVPHARPRALYRTYLQRDSGLRHAMRWYSQMGRCVWPYEIINFLLDPLTRNLPSRAKFEGARQDAKEDSMQDTARRTSTRNSVIIAAPAGHSIATPGQ